MNTDEFLPHLPPHVRGDFVRAVARARMRADYQASQAELRGYSIGAAQQAATCLDGEHNHN